MERGDHISVTQSNDREMPNMLGQDSFQSSIKLLFLKKTLMEQDATILQQNGRVDLEIKDPSSLEKNPE